MPMIDVSIALTNPYTADLINVIRRQEVVNNSGLSVLTTISLNNIPAVVHKAKPNDLKRLPESQRQLKTIAVHTLFALRGSSQDTQGNSYQPDLVVWHGDAFTVTDLEDYSSFSAGFTKATCPIQDFVAVPPNQVIVVFPAIIAAVGRMQIYIPTQVSSTVFTLPISPLVQNMLLFRNGVLQSSPGDFGIVGNTITLVVPLGTGDFLVVFA